MFFDFKCLGQRPVKWAWERLDPWLHWTTSAEAGLEFLRPPCAHDQREGGGLVVAQDDALQRRVLPVEERAEAGAGVPALVEVEVIVGGEVY